LNGEHIIYCFINTKGKKIKMKITKILILGAHLKFNNLIVLVFKKGNESK
jgi:hypothetical protein